jgi:hypothetical protein
MKMKRRILAAIIITLALSLAYVPSSYAGYRHGYHGGGGWYAAGAVAGGILLGTVIGSAISQPRYVAPAPVYAYPAAAHVYVYPSGGPAYVAENPPGEWVMAPGRWMNGRWIPAHRVWIPVNPY